MAEASPSPNGSNGRTAAGRFAPGWKGGSGNPHSRRVARLRAALLRAVSVEDIDQVVKTLVRQARAGDIAAIKELLSRTLGPPTELDLLARLEQLEEQFGLRNDARK